MVLYFVRLIFLFLTFAFGVISGSLGASAEAKSNHEENRVTGFVPAALTIDTNVGDIRRPAYAVIVASFVVGILALISFLITLAMTRTEPSSRNLLVQALCLLICTLWLLGSAIAYTVVFATGSAHVAASFYGIPIPPSIINQFLQQHGIRVQYRHIHYLRLLAVFPWITWMFASLSIVTLLVSSYIMRSPRRPGDRIAREL